MNVIDRLEIIRKEEQLNKAQFERKLDKSTGYLNMLMRRNSSPSVSVIQKIGETFPDYSLNWLMTGEGSMKKETLPPNTQEPPAAYQPADDRMILAVRDDLKQDLSEMSKGMTKNFEILSNGMMRIIQDQRKIIEFIEKIDADKISAASDQLDQFLKQVDE